MTTSRKTVSSEKRASSASNAALAAPSSKLASASPSWFLPASTEDSSPGDDRFASAAASAAANPSERCFCIAWTRLRSSSE